MTGSTYSYDALIKHCEYLKESQKYSKSKAGGWLTACRKVLTGLLPEEHEDIRKVDLFAAASKFKAATGAKEKTESEYRNRVQAAISEFVDSVNETAPEKSTVHEKIPADVADSGKQEILPSPRTKRSSKSSSPGVNTISVQIRSDFLAQIILPLDLKTAEAEHLCKLIKALPMDQVEA